MPTAPGWTSIVPGSAFQAVDEENPLPVTQAGGSSTLDSMLARPGNAATVSTNSVVTTATGVSLTYTVPVGNMAFVPAMGIINLAGSVPTMQARYTSAATGLAVVLSQDALVATTQLLKNVNLWMVAGDKVDWNVQAGGAGSTAAAYISILQIPIF